MIQTLEMVQHPHATIGLCCAPRAMPADLNIGSKFLMDTGAPETLLTRYSESELNAMASVGSNFAEEPSTSITDLAGSTVQARKLCLSSLEVAGFEATQPVVEALPRTGHPKYADDVLGLSFLQHWHTVIFDFPNERLICIPFDP